MKAISKNAIIGYPAGIITGITYGLNPLFALPLMKEGASIESILFFRYIISVLLLGAFLFLSKQSFRINLKQAGILFVLGLLYTSSSIFLFEAFKYIASGLATALIFLYPVLVAIIMVFLKVIPSWPVWLSIFLTFAGVVIMTQSDSTQTINPSGVFLSLGAALAYAMFIVIINRSKTIHNISNSLLTFYALSVGAIVFFYKAHDVGCGNYHRSGKQHGLAEPHRSCHPADHCLNRHAGCRNQKHRCDQSLRTRCIRADNRNPYRCVCFWRTDYHKHHCRHSDLDGSSDIHDSQNQKVKRFKSVKDE